MMRHFIDSAEITFVSSVHRRLYFKYDKVIECDKINHHLFLQMKGLPTNFV